MILLVALILYPAPPQESTIDDYKGVAIVDGMGISVEHLGSLMAKHKIKGILMGSLSYFLSVAPSDLKRATKIVTDDATLRPYHYIDVAGMDQKKLGLPDEKYWKVYTVNAAWEDLDKTRILQNDANLRTLAKNGLRQVRNTWGKDLECYVTRIVAFDMEYIARDLKLRHGYKATVYVHKKYHSQEASLNMWAWENGSRVETRSAGL